jgi:glycosyltransferase involved in cell wall biosynthesis
MTQTTTGQTAAVGEWSEPPPDTHVSGPADLPDQSGDRAAKVDPRPSVSVVIPAYNEAAMIERSLERVCEYLTTIEADYAWEVVVVNDGSSDATGALAEAVAARWTQVRIIHHRTNLNLGQALRTAFGECRGDYVVTLDSDLSYSPDHVGLLLDAIRLTDAKIVLASPYAKGGRTTGIPFIRLFLSRSANRFLWLTTKRQLATLTSMARVYDRAFLDTLNLKSTDVAINTEIIYKARLLSAKICEIPAHLDWTGQQEKSAERRSSLRLSRSVSAYLSSGFLFRPVAFFLLPGLILLALSLYTLAWATHHVLGYLTGPLEVPFSDAVALAYGDAPHTFLVGGFSLVIAFQLIGLGVLSAQSKIYFEELFHLNSKILRQKDLAQEIPLVRSLPSSGFLRPRSTTAPDEQPDPRADNHPAPRRVAT